MINDGLFTSKTGLYATPLDFYELLNDEFHFTLDPCFTVDNHKCDKFFTIEQNGLIQDWSQDIVFMNLPYGREIIKWVKKSF